MKLFLFDIDGTILRTDGVGRRGFAYALDQVLGRRIAFDEISFSGKTDPQIFAEILDRLGIPAQEAQALLPELLAHYSARMQETLPTARVTPMPGVVSLVEHLAGRDDVLLGLLTGNLEPMAYLKLERIGLEGYFDVGAFGSDSAHRPDLPAIAVERAAARTGQTFAGKDVVIIGDTEHDILCGRDIGAYAVGVCTGHFDREHLSAHAPDLLLESLENAGPLLALLS